MSGQSWSIKITSNGFEVDAYDQSGSTLNCQNGDVVSWNNTTGQPQTPIQTDSTFRTQQGALCAEIAAGKSSTPGYIPDFENSEGVAIPGKIYYVLKSNPAQQGILNVVE
jgi:hypothetical protein